jgi:EAL domain-containing protein (putative c-di-GMP-specific phosphodiesterase class I)
VEKETDELMCKGMSATYLQGFRYSRPTPIEELRGYICRRNIS